MTDDLVKRLRSRNVFAHPAEGQRLALLAEEAADRIEALTAEVLEQARLLGMSAERELALRAENERLRGF